MRNGSLNGQGSIRAYMKSISSFPLLNKEEERELGRRVFIYGDQEARQKLIESNLRLVVHIARKHFKFGLELGDLIEEGNLGLIEAAGSYNFEKGEFSTYAGWWIRKYMQWAVSSEGKEGMTISSKVRKSIKRFSIDEAFYQGDEFVSNGEFSPEGIVSKRELGDLISKELDSPCAISEREAKVLSSLYLSRRKMNQKELAKLVNLSRATIGAIRASGIGKLRAKYEPI